VKLSLSGQQLELPWDIVSLKLRVGLAPGILEGADVGFSEEQTQRLIEVTREKMNHPNVKNPLVEMYNCLRE